MVARDRGTASPSSATTGPGRGPAGRAFLAWRRLLTRLLLRGRRTVPGRPAVPLAALVGSWVRDPAEALREIAAADLRRLGGVGIVALLTGAAGGAVVTVARAGRPLAALVGAASALLWAAARFGVLRLATPPTEGARVADAWACGLVPLALAVIFPLDVVALLASWIYTLRSLVALGLGRRTAWTATGLAFGGQVAVAVAVWALRGGLIVAAGAG
jgi:hypothetical protein